MREERMTAPDVTAQRPHLGAARHARKMALSRKASVISRCLQFVLWFLALGAPFAGAQAKEEVIRVVIDDSYPPYIYLDPDGKPQGIVRDLWTLWEKRTGTRVEIITLGWNEAQAAINTGRAEVIDTIFKTDDRLARYDFSAPYAAINVGLFYPRSLQPITDTLQLKDYLIGVSEGDSCIDYLKAKGSQDLKTFSDYETLVKAAIRGEIAVFCMDMPPATFLLERENAQHRFRSLSPLYTGHLHWAVRKGEDSLLRQIGEGFAKISPQERQLIERRWLSTEAAPPIPDWMIRYGMALVVAITLTGIGLASWNRLLNMRVAEITQDLQLSSRQLVERITELEQARNDLEESQSLLRTLVRAIPYPVSMKDPHGRFIFCNAFFERFYGVSEHNLINKRSADVMDEALAKAQESADALAVAGTAPYVYEDWFIDQSTGLRRLMEVTKTSVISANGRLLGSIGISHDVTERRAYEKQLEVMAHYDVLTGLPNRALLTDRLRLALAQETRRGSNLAVVYLDLDGFKEVNDRHGHDIGDQLLISLALRMKDALREGDTLARLGGDEFVALLCDLDDINTCVPWLNRLLGAASKPVVIDGRTLQVSASVGTTFYPQDDPVDADQLLRQADQAMYQAKLAGKNRFYIFDADHYRSVREHHETLDHIRSALESEQFVLHYQPKVNMRSGALIGVEALIRWQHPIKGLLGPAAFLPVIEDDPLSVDVGEWVIVQALEQLNTWRGAGLLLPVSINVSARQFHQGDFVTRLKTLFAAYPTVPPSAIQFEILETSALGDLPQVAAIIEQCRELGIHFSLDDFGTGYSSLTYLKRLDIEEIKIDKSFVHDMLDDPDDLAILAGILGLSRSLGCKVVAEGVETIAQGEALLELGCDLAQGYGITPPLPAEDVLPWSSRWAPPESWSAKPAFSAADFPLLVAQVENRAWFAALENFIHGQRNDLPLLHHMRHLKHWMENDGRMIYGHLPGFRELERLEETIHRQANELYCQKSAGQGDEAAAGLGKLSELNQTLRNTLAALNPTTASEHGEVPAAPPPA